MQIVKLALFFVFIAVGWAQTGGLSIVNGVINFGSAPHTATIKIVANVPALPAAGCTVGELAVVTSATLGQQIYQNSGSGACVWTQQLNTGSSNGGGITVYSAPSLSLSGTQYIPIGGGGLPSTTETNSDTPSPSAATVTNFEVQISAAPGMGNSIAFTWRKNAVSQSLTCTISGAVATSCSDTVNSFSVSQGDLLSIQLVTTGVIAGTPQLITAVQFGTVGSNGTVNSGGPNQFAYYLGAGTAVSGSGAPEIANVVAPSTPAAGNSKPYFDSTQKVLSSKDDAGAVTHTVQTKDCSSGSQLVQKINADGTVTCASQTAQLHTIGFTLDGAGSAITTGDAKVYPTAAFACTINRIDISADQSGSITVDVWKAAGAIPTSGNKISASAPLTLSSAQLAQNGSLTGWTTTVSSGDVFGFSVATVSTVTRVVGQIWCQ